MKKHFKSSIINTGIIFSLFACSSNVSNNYAWTLVDLGNEVEIHTELQLDYLYDNYDNVGRYVKGNKELSRPEPVHFTWEAISKKEDAPTIEKYELQISEDKNFSSYESLFSNENKLDVYNLKIATNYYWRVNAYLHDGTLSYSNTKNFRTTDFGPRNLYVDGVTNVRDIGGWETSSNGRVKQGMIFRSGRLNKSESEEVVVEITEDGIKTMTDTLGIRCEIDLRRVDNNEVGSITSSPLGESTFYYSCPMNWEGTNLLLDNVESVKEVFSILGDINNYPLFYHCNIGTDRTGLFSYLINGLMDVSEEDLYRDYLFSNYGLINGTRSIYGILNSYVATIKEYDGNSLSEKIKNCLVDLGVLESDINAMMDILKEK